MNVGGCVDIGGFCGRRCCGILFGMAETMAYVLVHLVFSTKRRKPWFNDGLRGELHTQLASVLSHSENICLSVGGAADHVHIALFLARNESVKHLVERVKGASSKWIIGKGPEFKSFRWQQGYAAFSAGLSDRAALVRYIEAQAAYHQRHDFQAEMRAIFAKYEVGFDEQFVWN